MEKLKSNEKSTVLSSNTQKEEYAISNFYFLVFTSNPNTDMVKLYIDDGSIRMIMKVEKLIKIIKELCSEKLSKYVRQACCSYGDFFILDRDKGTLVQLQPIIKNEKMYASQIKDMCSERSNSNELKTQYLNSLDACINNVLNSPVKNNRATGNKFNKVVNINSSNINRGYRPY